MRRLLVDFGSTFTKGVLVDSEYRASARLASAVTRLDGEILHSLFDIQAKLGGTFRRCGPWRPNSVCAGRPTA